MTDLDFTWDRPFEKMPDHIRITDANGGVHMANLHEQALIKHVEAMRSEHAKAQREGQARPLVLLGHPDGTKVFSTPHGVNTTLMMGTRHVDGTHVAPQALPVIETEDGSLFAFYDETGQPPVALNSKYSVDVSHPTFLDDDGKRVSDYLSKVTGTLVEEVLRQAAYPETLRIVTYRDQSAATPTVTIEVRAYGVKVGG